MKYTYYKCKINRVIDGDTVDIDLYLGFEIVLQDQRVRLYGIDTPESRTSDEVEKKFGLASKARLKELLKNAEKIVLQTHLDKHGDDEKGKFGRILGDFLVDGVSVSETLINEHQAVAYFGQSKDDVQDEHMKNREILINEGIVKL